MPWVKPGHDAGERELAPAVPLLPRTSRTSCRRCTARRCTAPSPSTSAWPPALADDEVLALERVGSRSWHFDVTGGCLCRSVASLTVTPLDVTVEPLAGLAHATGCRARRSTCSARRSTRRSASCVLRRGGWLLLVVAAAQQRRRATTIAAISTIVADDRGDQGHLAAARLALLAALELTFEVTARGFTALLVRRHGRVPPGRQRRARSGPNLRQSTEATSAPAETDRRSRPLGRLGGPVVSIF